MKEIIEINGINYEFVKDFKHNEALRLSFNRLTEAVFHFSLENWFHKGYWGDHYIPYSLIFDNEVISNVSINKVEFLVDDKRKKGIQIGTVMTQEDFRHRGLNKFLLERIISEWEDKVDFIYLFANNTVLDFYPKFNFERIEEYQYSKSIESVNDQSSLRQLNIENKDDLNLIRQTIRHSKPISKVSMLNNEALVMFYCLFVKKESIYYVEAFKAVIIADINDNTILLNDVFSETHVDLNDLIKVITNQTINKVILGFTPLDKTNYDINLLEPDDTLFVLKTNNNIFNGNKYMFPILSHA